MKLSIKLDQNFQSNLIKDLQSDLIKTFSRTWSGLIKVWSNFQPKLVKTFSQTWSKLSIKPDQNFRSKLTKLSIKANCKFVNWWRAHTGSCLNSNFLYCNQASLFNVYNIKLKGEGHVGPLLTPSLSEIKTWAMEQILNVRTREMLEFLPNLQSKQTANLIRNPHWVLLKFKIHFIIIEHLSSMYIIILIHINGP